VLAALDAGDREGALDVILEALPGAPQEQRERLREIAVAIFEALGQEDPVTVSYRRRLASALY
jgi:thioredoxin-like negative regulator of GroEL